jgi:hypothetical protein
MWVNIGRLFLIFNYSTKEEMQERRRSTVLECVSRVKLSSLLPLFIDRVVNVLSSGMFVLRIHMSKNCKDEDDGDKEERNVLTARENKNLLPIKTYLQCINKD